jgi:uncharacterized membrane protein
MIDGLSPFLSFASLAAYLGGSLVYEYGTGVQRQGKALEIKEKQG